MSKYHRTPDEDSERVALYLNKQELAELVEGELHGFALRAGAMLVAEMLEAQVAMLCGRPRERHGARKAYRYGRQHGSIVMNGQKIGIERPRIRSVDNRRELELELYNRLRQKDLMPEGVLRRAMRGVSSRHYREVVETLVESTGVSRSSVSRATIAATERRLRVLLERRFHETRFPVIFIDGVNFQGQTLIAVIGVRESGEKVVLSVREGATENARVCIDLLEELRERGVSTEVATLFILDGSKALLAAVKRVWGEKAIIQRCRAHKLRNVQAYVPDPFWPEIATRIRSAYAEADYMKAKRMLVATIGRLEQIAPAAAASLREGLEETLTVTRLKLPLKLRRGLSTTNVVENAFSRVRTICGRVKRWRPSMRLRWCGAALVEAENRFHRCRGFEDLAALLTALDGRKTEKEDKAA